MAVARLVETQPTEGAAMSSDEVERNPDAADRNDDEVEAHIYDEDADDDDFDD
jgi:hypothetical protein